MEQINGVEGVLEVPSKFQGFVQGQSDIFKLSLLKNNACINN